MTRWKWFQPADETAPVNVTGPATIYPDRAGDEGDHAPAEAAADQAAPSTDTEGRLHANRGPRYRRSRL